MLEVADGLEVVGYTAKHLPRTVLTGWKRDRQALRLQPGYSLG